SSIGAGIDAFNSPLTLTDSLVSANHAVTGGGGLHLLADSPISISTVSGCTFFGNEASYGGALVAHDLVLTIRNSTISRNTATSKGGGIFNGTFSVGGGLTVRNSTISGNTATTKGGGIYNDGSDVVVQNSTIAFNRAGLDGTSTGGGISSNEG